MSRRRREAWTVVLVAGSAGEWLPVAVTPGDAVALNDACRLVRVTTPPGDPEALAAAIASLNL